MAGHPHPILQSLSHPMGDSSLYQREPKPLYNEV